jgi:hypothetical protein
MKIPALLRFALCAFVATALSLSAVAQTAAGRIKAAKVEGEVTKISASGSSVPLKAGDELTETDAVLTGKTASVVLVFSNGSSVKVGPASRLAVDEFKMDPLAEDIKISELKDEPAVSKTTLNLAYGEMVGDVKKLNKSSSYSIKTPVGAAGIRGTIYRIVFRPSTDGKAFFTVSTAEGLVVFEGTTDVPVPVPEGKEVVVEVDVNAPGTIDSSKVVTQDIPAETRQVFEDTSAVFQAVGVDLYQLNTPPTPPSTTPPAETPPNTPPPPEPVAPPAPPPNLTPGAGD